MIFSLSTFNIKYSCLSNAAMQCIGQIYKIVFARVRCPVSGVRQPVNKIFCRRNTPRLGVQTVNVYLS